MNYDWMALIVFFVTLVGLTKAGRFLAFRSEALQGMRSRNREADRKKLARKRFRSVVDANNRVGLIANLVFYATVLPFCVTLDSRPLWRDVVDILLVLMVFDFFYYFTHRFLFHGPALRKIHALHHQARTPTYADAFYVHPIETMIGLFLFLGTIPLVAWIEGGPLNAIAMAIATLLFTQLNTLNHTWVNLPRFPFKTLSRITAIHAAHHVDMNRGNYSTLSTLYDWMFGTLEVPSVRTDP
ncbi:MAG: sterol desaturase family protein [Myxococcota bacterium]|nr:sterol desaturase family protein [Myxococcota bacterium]